MIGPQNDPDRSDTHPGITAEDVKKCVKIQCQAGVGPTVQVTTRAAPPPPPRMSAQPGLSTCVAIHNTRIIHRVHGAINLNTTVIRVDASEMSLSKRIVLAAHLEQVQISSNSMITALVFKTSVKSGSLSISIPSFVFRRRPRRAVTAVKCSRRSFPSRRSLQAAPYKLATGSDFLFTRFWTVSRRAER